MSLFIDDFKLFIFLFILYDFDYCLGNFPNDFKVVIFVFLDFYERNLFGFIGFLTRNVVNVEDFISLNWRGYRGWVFSYAITEELHAPVFTPE